MKLLIIRHGQTDGNVKGLVQGAGLDLPLNETGRAQAAAAAEKLLSLHLPVIYSCLLYTSDAADGCRRRAGRSAFRRSGRHAFGRRSPDLRRRVRGDQQ